MPNCERKKIECVTITLMNRALDSIITKGDPKQINVQLENNDFSLGSFEVWYDLLEFVFNLTNNVDFTHFFFYA